MIDAEDSVLSRPHEDRERHTLVDHRGGGSPVTFADGSWAAVGVARVKAERSDACIAAYETLVEKAQQSNVHAGPAVVFASENGRRVVTVVGVRGHDGFRHLAAAWDDHHRSVEHRVISESVTFALYEVVAGTGARDIDPASHDAYVYERVDRPVPHASALFGALPEFVGASVFYDDDANATIILSRFGHIAAYDGFRTTRDAHNALGSARGEGETSFRVRPRKTLALAMR
jgi:hypothetical protein